jgi:hypothetical protein
MTKSAIDLANGRPIFVNRKDQIFTKSLLIMPILGGIFLSRFAIPIFGSQLAISLISTVISAVGLVSIGKLRVNVPRFILFTLSLAAVLLSAACAAGVRFSLTSLLLFAVLYLGYVFVVDTDTDIYPWVISAFRKICVIVAICGILQYFGQFLLPGPQLFTFDDYFPKSYLQLYHYVDPVAPGRNKSNGFFLPEPSIFGQLMALALILELGVFRNIPRILLYCIAQYVAFSGTGIMLCAFFVPFFLARERNPFVILAAIGVGIVLLTSWGSSFMQPFDRVGEFGATRSSAFARFISPFYLFDEYIFDNSRSVLFGLGPGSIETFFNNFYTDVFDPTWGKLLFEYGLVGSLPFAAFILSCFFLDTRTRWLSGALFINYLIMGGYLLSTPWNGIILSLAIWHRSPVGQMRRHHDQLRKLKTSNNLAVLGGS